MRPISTQAVFRFSYAVSLHVGAVRACDDGKAAISQVGIPTFLLIGFSLENAFAAYLIACEHAQHGDYKKHDLERAMNACAGYGLVLSKPDAQFVKNLNPMHRDFVFRYPERMDRVDLGELKAAIRTTKNILRDVDVGLKIRGFDVSTLASLIPE
jgi:hypothetical protein